MKKSYKTGKSKRLLSLLLSSLMLMSAGAALAACGDDEDSSVDNSNASNNETDTARIKNGSFEFYDDNDGKNLIITSPTGWSRSTDSSSQGSAYSSKSASGIVDTSEEAWNNLTTSSGKPHANASEAEANWDKLTAKDKLEFYKSYKDESKDNKVDDLSFYKKEKDNYNISIDDVPLSSKKGEDDKYLPLQNPLTHDYSAENAASEEYKSHVLMLHNAYTDYGTAQYYSSSTTIQVEPGTSAIFSLWVKTMDLTYNKGTEVDGNRGAYIRVSHSIGNTSLDPVEIKNIDTSLLNPEGENNGWVQYNFYLKGCAYAQSTFSVVLGLGEGGGNDRYGYVDGYAFFDDVTCSVVSNDAYDKKLPSELTTVSIGMEAEDKVFKADAEKKDEFDYQIDLHHTFADYKLEGIDFKLTEEKQGSTTYVSSSNLSGMSNDASVRPYGQVDRKRDNDVTAVFASYNALKSHSNKNLQTVLGRDFKEDKYPFDKGNDNILMLLSSDGAAYTASLGSRTEPAFVLKGGERIAISFWVKTSDLSGFTGASVTLREAKGSNTDSISSIDTTAIAQVDIDLDEGLQEDIYDGWQQCFFFVENPNKDALNELGFYLTFTYGPTAISGSTNSQYYAGYAAFANFETYTNMTEKEFSYAATGTYAKSISLQGEEKTYTETGFDSVATVPSDAIENGLANPRTFKGVYGGSGYIVAGGNAEDNKVNQNESAGLVNREYAENYRKAALEDENYWLAKLAKQANVTLDENDEWWTTLFGTSVQPLVIYNTESTAYGYIGASETASSSGYKAVSVKVKASKGAKAYVYLTDMSDSKSRNPLTIETLANIYWYDASGNVCDLDPKDGDFDKKKNIALNLDKETGLYEINKNWQHYQKNYEGIRFANLKNYEADEDGNLLVADGGVSYNYDANLYRHEGNDGIAYYAKDGKYYADKACTKEVVDFSMLTDLPARYENAVSKELVTEITGTGEWEIVNFYLHMGNTERKYRLEVWSGDRLGTTKNDKDSYVLFDLLSRSIDSKYTNLVDEAIEDLKGDMTDEEFKASGKAVYYAYSFYDSPKFLRYDSALDKDKVGNKYGSYDATSYTEGVAYLEYKFEEDINQWTTFVDYSYSDVTVTADTNTDDNDTDDDTDDENNDANWWLLASSIILAVVLVIAVISLAIRKFMKKSTIGKKANKTTKANTAKRRYEKKAEEPKEPEAVEPKAEPKDDENNPYND